MATTPASLSKHPLHPMLVALPIGLLSFSVVCDILWYFGIGGDDWRTVAVYTLAGGVVTGLIAAIPGLIDLMSLKDPGLRRVGWIHLVVNVIAIGAFVVALAMRTGSNADADKNPIPMLVSIMGLLLLTVGGWLGGHLVHVRGVSVAGVSESHLSTHSSAPQHSTMESLDERTDRKESRDPGSRRI